MGTVGFEWTHPLPIGNFLWELSPLNYKPLELIETLQWELLSLSYKHLEVIGKLPRELLSLSYIPLEVIEDYNGNCRR